MISSRESERLDVMRFPLIVGVVFIHAYGSSVGLAGGAVGSEVGFGATLIQDLISKGMARTAVPLFFLMSGYLFFQAWELSRPGYVAKLRSRVPTLLVPFLFWNMVVLAVVASAQLLPITQQYFSGKHEPIYQYDWWEMLSALLGIGRMPVAYQFWFIRDLMLLVVAAPLIYVLVRRQRFLFSTILGAIWLVGEWPLYMPSIEALFFFCAGAALALSGSRLFIADGMGRWLGALYVVLLAADMTLRGQEYHGLVHRLAILVGVMCMLCLSGWIVDSDAWRQRLVRLSATSFFVFAAHEPLITIARKVAYKVIRPNSDVEVLVLYFLLPALTCAVLVVVYRMLSMLSPRLLRVITGGR